MAKGLLQKEKKPIELSRGLIITAVVSFLVVLVIVIGYWQLNKYQQVKNRDLERLADMKELQIAFESLFSEEYSYQGASSNGCQKGDLVDQCNLEKYLPRIDYFKDPGGFSYLITLTPSQDNFEISFILERQAGELSPGEHTLSSVGIK